MSLEDSTECGDPSLRNQYWSAYHIKQQLQKYMNCPPTMVPTVVNLLGGDEDCGDDDDCGSQFHNRNNLNQDELGGALRE